MNITYILGNGFDLNIGLNTHYKDFYDYYIEVSSNNKDIDKLKNKIKDNYNDNWSDLESALGKYTKEVSDVDIMCDIIEDINENLTNYIRGIERKIPENNNDIKGLIIDDIIKPEKYLNNRYKDKLNLFNANIAHSNAEINIISLNYTSTFEKMIIDKTPLEVGLGFMNKKVTIENIYHLHHKIDKDDTIILGVGDESQILNEQFRNNEKIKEYLIKSVTNQMLGSNIDSVCSKIISTTNLFILYGVSLGETDNKLWNEIAKCLLHNKDSKLLIFEYNPIYIGGLRQGREEKEVEEKLTKQIDKNLSIQDIKDRIIVSINSSIFSNVKQYITIKSYQHGDFAFNYSNNNGEYIIGDGIRAFSTKWSKGSDVIIHAYSDAPNIESIGLIKNLKDFDNIAFLNIDYSSRVRDAHVGDAIVWKNINGYHAVTKIIDIKDDTRNDDRDEINCEYALY